MSFKFSFASNYFPLIALFSDFRELCNLKALIMFAYFVLPSFQKQKFLCKIDIDTFFPEYWINSISFDSCQARNLNPNERVYYNFRFVPWCHWQIQILLWRMGLMSRKISDDLGNCDAVSHVKNFFLVSQTIWLTCFLHNSSYITT